MTPEIKQAIELLKKWDIEITRGYIGFWLPIRQDIQEVLALLEKQPEPSEQKQCADCPTERMIAEIVLCNFVCDKGSLISHRGWIALMKRIDHLTGHIKELESQKIAVNTACNFSDMGYEGQIQQLQAEIEWLTTKVKEAEQK